MVKSENTNNWLNIISSSSSPSPLPSPIPPPPQQPPPPPPPPPPSLRIYLTYASQFARSGDGLLLISVSIDIFYY